MADGDFVSIPRKDPSTTNQRIESIEQQVNDLGDVRLMQTVCRKGIIGATTFHDKKTATTTSQTLLAANDKRVIATFVNMSSETVYISGNADATVDDWPLRAGEGFVDQVSTVHWRVRSTSGSAVVHVLEVRLP